MDSEEISGRSFWLEGIVLVCFPICKWSYLLLTCFSLSSSFVGGGFGLDFEVSQCFMCLSATFSKNFRAQYGQSFMDFVSSTLLFFVNSDASGLMFSYIDAWFFCYFICFAMSFCLFWMTPFTDLMKSSFSFLQASFYNSSSSMSSFTFWLAY